MAVENMERVVFATDIFIREMRSQWFKQHPSANPEDCPVKPLSEYPAAHQTALAISVNKSIRAMTEMDDVFAQWQARKKA
jgi:hypothetical protein